MGEGYIMFNESDIDRTKRFEGLRRKPYRCSAGKLTIGYGRNLDDVGISTNEAEYMFQNDWNNCVASVKKNVMYFDKLPENVQTVLIDMRFNLGLAGLLGFRKMLQAISGGDYQEAKKQLLDSRYAKQVGIRAIENAEYLTLHIEN